jgi:hypothetical protein
MVVIQLTESRAAMVAKVLRKVRQQFHTPGRPAGFWLTAESRGIDNKETGT